MAMTNAEWMIKHGYKFRDLLVREAEKGKHGFRICIATSDGTCKKIGETEHVYNNRLTSVILWLDEEHKEQILDDAEKRYLASVIRPFRNRVMSICKANYNGSGNRYQYLFIIFSDVSFVMELPVFEKETMYKGMKHDHLYSIEELGL